MPKKSVKSRKNEKESTEYKNIIIGSVAGTVLFFAFVAVFSAVALKTDFLSDSSYMPIGLFSAALSSLIGGYAAVRPVMKNGALYGFLSGLLQSFVTATILYFINSRNSGTGILVLMAVIIGSAVAGGISAVNIKVRKKYK